MLLLLFATGAGAFSPSSIKPPTLTSFPSNPTTGTSASFAFTAKAASFQCSLDNTVATKCSSPVTYTQLAAGSHTFSVSAIDWRKRESSPATYSWTIVASPAPAIDPPPPPPTITSQPPSVTAAATASFSFSDAAAGVTFQCQADQAAFTACANPYELTNVVAGGHIFAVKAIGTTGTASTATTSSWTVDQTPPTVSIVAPLAQATVSGSVSVAVNAADASGIAKVTLAVDGTVTSSVTSTPFALTWDASTASAGSHTLQATANDVAGNPATSAAITVNVPSAPVPTWSCAGVTVSPGPSIQSAVDSNPSGTTFCMTAGIYRLTAAIAPKAGDQFVGQTGAIISGAKDISGLFAPLGSYWVASGQSQSNPNHDGQCLTGTACTYADDVYFDNSALTRVLSLTDLGPGKFFFDYSNQRIYIGDNPAGHVVEAAVAKGAFNGWGTAGDNVTIENIVIEKFANAAQTGAIQGLSAWTIKNCEVRLNHGTGILGGFMITGNYVHHNGQLGMNVQDGPNQVVSNNEIAFNNYAGFDPHWEAGGAKFLRTTGLEVNGNYVHDNEGPGLWTDWDNVNTTYENNRIEDNSGPGIMHECSYAAVIRNNVIRRNGFAFTGWLDGSGIVVDNSENVDVYGNTVEKNLQGIGLIVTARGPGKYGAHDLLNVTVHNNTITMAANSFTGLVQGLNDSTYYTSKGNRFTANNYTLCTPTMAFAWQGSGPNGYAYISKTEWIADGNDVGGQFALGC